MIKINLLPVRQLRKKQKMQTELAGFAAVVIGMLFVISMVALNRQHVVTGLKEKNVV